MSKNALFSAQGSYLVGVDVDEANKCDLLDLIRTKKMAEGMIETAPRYDWDGDGDVDGNDVKKVRNILLGLEKRGE